MGPRRWLEADELTDNISCFYKKIIRKTMFKHFFTFRATIVENVLSRKEAQ